MEITYLGHSCFKIKTKEATLVADPFDPELIGIKFPLTDCDIVTVSHNHPDHNFLGRLRNYRKVINEPGEYELSNISIIGIPTFHDTKKGEERGPNTIFVYETEELRIAHLGDLGHKLTEKVVEEMGDINILMISVGHPMSLATSETVEIVRQIEPEIILPMHYKMQNQKGKAANLISPDEFLKELSLPVEKAGKLMVKISDISTEEQKVVLLDVRDH